MRHQIQQETARIDPGQEIAPHDDERTEAAAELVRAAAWYAANWHLVTLSRSEFETAVKAA